jgi:hypothetical protein
MLVGLARVNALSSEVSVVESRNGAQSIAYRQALRADSSGVGAQLKSENGPATAAD